MSTQKFTIENEAVLNTIRTQFHTKIYDNIDVFNARAMSVLIDMQNTTSMFFNYAFCPDYIEALLHTLRCSLFGSNYIEETHSDERDGKDLPETVTLNREEAGSMFHLINMTIKYLGDMNFHQERFDACTKKR